MGYSLKYFCLIWIFLCTVYDMQSSETQATTEPWKVNIWEKLRTSFRSKILFGTFILVVRMESLYYSDREKYFFVTRTSKSGSYCRFTYMWKGKLMCHMLIRVWFLNQEGNKREETLMFKFERRDFFENKLDSYKIAKDVLVRTSIPKLWACY